MLLFNAYSPVGHAIHVCSMMTFVIGDEDVVLPNFEPVTILANLLLSLWFQKLKLSLILIFKMYLVYPSFFQPIKLFIYPLRNVQM